MKKLLFVLIFTLILPVTANASTMTQKKVDKELAEIQAAEEYQNLAPTISLKDTNNQSQSVITLIVNGNPLQTDVPPIIENGRTLVPLKVIGEALGVEFNWFQDTQSINYIQGNIIYVLKINNNIVEKVSLENNKTEKITIDVAPKIINSRTLVPLRFIADSLGAEVSYDGNTKTVYIVSQVNLDNKVKSEDNSQNKTASTNTQGSKYPHPSYKADGTLDLTDWVRTSPTSTSLLRHMASGDIIYYKSEFWASPRIATNEETIMYSKDIASEKSNTIEDYPELTPEMVLNLNKENYKQEENIGFEIEKYYPDWYSLSGLKNEGINVSETNLQLGWGHNLDEDLKTGKASYSCIGKIIFKDKDGKVLFEANVNKTFLQGDNTQFTLNGVKIELRGSDLNEIYFYGEDLLRLGIIK